VVTTRRRVPAERKNRPFSGTAREELRRMLSGCSGGPRRGASSGVPPRGSGAENRPPGASRRRPGWRRPGRGAGPSSAGRPARRSGEDRDGRRRSSRPGSSPHSRSSGSGCRRASPGAPSGRRGIPRRRPGRRDLDLPHHASAHRRRPQLLRRFHPRTPGLDLLHVDGLGTLSPSARSKVTGSPSLRVWSFPPPLRAVRWTKMSCPSSVTMNPYPFSRLNHFTFPCAIGHLPAGRHPHHRLLAAGVRVSA